MATNFKVKVGEIGLLTFINHSLPLALAFQNRVEYRNSNLKGFNGDDLATLCKHLMNFGPGTSEFKRLKGVHPSSISNLATFAWRRHC